MTVEAVLDAGHGEAARLIEWDIRALDAADAVTEQRVQEHHTSLHSRFGSLFLAGSVISMPAGM